MIHSDPVCFVCHETVAAVDAIFAPLCVPPLTFLCSGGDHEHCPSLAFHPLCRMEWMDLAHSDEFVQNISRLLS